MQKTKAELIEEKYGLHLGVVHPVIDVERDIYISHYLRQKKNIENQEREFLMRLVEALENINIDAVTMTFKGNLDDWEVTYHYELEPWKHSSLSPLFNLLQSAAGDEYILKHSFGIEVESQKIKDAIDEIKPTTAKILEEIKEMLTDDITMMLEEMEGLR